MPPCPSEVSAPAKTRSNVSVRRAAARTSAVAAHRTDEGVVDDVDRSRGAHGEALAQRLGRAGWAHRQQRHLAAVRVGQLERGLEDVLVVAVGLELPACVRFTRWPSSSRSLPTMGTALTQDDDVHAG